MTFSYQWRSCASGSCSDIENATGSTYTLTTNELGETLEVVVTATNAAGSASATSADTPVVTAPAVAPANIGLPQVSGQAVVGQQLSTTDGSWSGTAATFSYQWRSCASGSCSDIENATGSTYTLTTNELGEMLEVVVTATNTAGSASATSDPTAPVTAATPIVTAPTKTGLPVISGNAQEGQQLSVSSGSWGGSPATYAYQWRSCASGNCTNIALATNETYDVSTSDVGKTLEVVVTATNTAGSASATSDPTAPVTAATPIVTAPTNTGLPVISGNAQEGQQLSVSSGSWGGSPATYAYQWRSCSSGSCTDIPTATDTTFTAGSSDVGKTLVAVVTASNDAGFAAATSTETAAVSAASPVIVRSGLHFSADDQRHRRVGAVAERRPGKLVGKRGQLQLPMAELQRERERLLRHPERNRYDLHVGCRRRRHDDQGRRDGVEHGWLRVGNVQSDRCRAGRLAARLERLLGGRVAFTFDDGPDIYTAQVMARLRALNLQATFFVLGSKVQQNPQMLRDAAAAGFGIGNHTYDHQSFTGASTSTAPLTEAQIQAELDDASERDRCRGGCSADALPATLRGHQRLRRPARAEPRLPDCHAVGNAERQHRRLARLDRHLRRADRLERDQRLQPQRQHLPGDQSRLARCTTATPAPRR